MRSVPAFICKACGVQFAESAGPPRECPICEDERQPVPAGGQAWTTLEELRAEGRRQDVRELEPGLVGIGVDPPFGIGQRALLLRTPEGNLLWDCTPLLEPERVEELGGVRCLAVSHPHFLSTLVEWAERFDAELLLNEADAEWEMRPAPGRTRRWGGELEPLPGVRLLRLGGHFEGSAVANWNGALLTGDTLQVLPGRDPRLSFMRSYPMLMPLPAAKVEEMAARLGPLDFDRIYGGWWEREIRTGGKRALEDSVARYVRYSSSTGTPSA
jgi:hypothetical protein